MTNYNNIDFYNYSIEEIENILKIDRIKEEQKALSNNAIVLDDWQEVAHALNFMKQRSKNNTNIKENVLGYELVYDNHYIKLYIETDMQR